MRRLPIIFVPAVAAAVLTATACGTPHTTAKPAGPATSTSQPADQVPAPAANPSGSVLNAQFGQTYNLEEHTYNNKGDNVTIPYTIVAYAPTLSQQAITAYGLPPRNGYFATFKVSITSHSSEEVTVNPLYFAVRDAANQTFDCGDELTQPGALQSLTLHQGQTAAGKVTADVPGRHGTLVYTPPGEASAIEWPF